MKKEKTKEPAYITVQEMRTHPEWIDPTGLSDTYQGGGRRYQGSTTSEYAYKYFPKEGEVLECGSIYGKFLRDLLDHGYKKVHTLDFVDKLHFVKKEELASFREIDFNLEKFPHPDNFFDGVAAWGIGEHLENQFFFMREAHRVLKPGGVFLFCLPNIFHIVSRMIFLKTGMFPRWSHKNNHITVLPRGVFEKTFLRYFYLMETVYTKPVFQVRGLNWLTKFLPANQWFGDYVLYVLRKKNDDL